MTLINKKLILINFFLLLVVLITFNKYYYIGGDASQYYYIDPLIFINDQYLYNFFWGNTVAGQGHAFSQIYQYPFFYLIKCLKIITTENLNTQGILFAINVIVAYNYFYLIVKHLNNEKKFSDLILTIIPIIYILNPFTYTTIATHGLYAIYLISYFPMLIYYLFFSNILGKILIVPISFLYSFTLFGIPWVIGTIICLLPFFVYLFLININKLQVILTISFICIVNFFWILPLYWLIYEIGIGDFGNVSIDTTKAVLADVTRLNSAIFPMMGLAMPRWYENKFSLYFGLAYGFIFIAIVYKYLSKPKIEFNVIKILILCWIFSVILYTLNFGISSKEIDFYSRLPLAGLFKNNFDKFSLGLGLSTTLMISLMLLKISSKYSKLCIVFILLYSAANIDSLIFSKLKTPLWSTNYTERKISSLSIEYFELIKYLNTINTNNVLFLPLNMPSYMIIKGVQSNENYIGSPIYNLNTYGKIGYWGKFSFTHYKNYDEFISMIHNNKTDEVINFLKNFGIDTIVLTNNIDEDLKKSYLFVNEINLLELSLKLANLLEKYKYIDLNNQYSIFRIPKNEYFQTGLREKIGTINFIANEKIITDISYSNKINLYINNEKNNNKISVNKYGNIEINLNHSELTKNIYLKENYSEYTYYLFIFCLSIAIIFFTFYLYLILKYKYSIKTMFS